MSRTLRVAALTLPLLVAAGAAAGAEAATRQPSTEQVNGAPLKLTDLPVGHTLDRSEGDGAQDEKSDNGTRQILALAHTPHHL